MRSIETTQEAYPAPGPDEQDNRQHAVASQGAMHAPPIRDSRDVPNAAPLFLPDARWDPELAQKARESIYFTKPWLDLVTRIYGYEIFPLTTVGADGRYTGVLPLCSVVGPLGSSRLVSLPFSDWCPMLATDAASASDLLGQAIHLTHQRKAQCVELRTGVHDMLAARPDVVAQGLYVRPWLRLDDDLHVVWSALRKPVQRQIKKSCKLGVQVRVAQTREDMDRYYRLHLRTRSKKLGMPAQSRAFFRELWNAFAAQGSIQVLLAEYEGALVAGMILLISGRTVRYAYGASDERYRHLAPNNLLMWTAITWGGTHGLKILDLGRTARDNVGLMEFKRRWGANEDPLPYYYHPRPAGMAATPERSWNYRALTAVWKRLPLSISAPVGGHLYKYLG